MGSTYDSATLNVQVADGIAMLADGSKFAGSITSVPKMVKNLIHAGIPVVDALKTGTSVRFCGVNKAFTPTYESISVMDDSNCQRNIERNHIHKERRKNNDYKRKIDFNDGTVQYGRKGRI